MSDILLLAIAVLVNFCLMMYFCIRQHRKTKNTVLSIIDGEWSLTVGRADAEKLMYIRRLVEQMTMADTLNMHTREANRAE